MTPEEQLQRKLWERLLSKEVNVFYDIVDYQKLLEDFSESTTKDEIMSLLPNYLFMYSKEKWAINGLRYPWIADDQGYSDSLTSLPKSINQHVLTNHSLSYSLNDKTLTYKGKIDYSSFQRLYNIPGTDQAYKRTISKVFESDLLPRVFIGDLVWLYYMDLMGVFRVLGVILDDYATKGKYPIAYNTITSRTLEKLVRYTKEGLASSVRERESAYRRCLSWQSDSGKFLDTDAKANSAFKSLFAKFIMSSLEYYNDKRLATAIRGPHTNSKPSAATLTTIGETIELLLQSFKSFEYGQNHSITVRGIIWAIITLGLIRDLRGVLGVSQSFDKPELYFTAAYDILISNRLSADTETNRYTVHKQCAENGRDILLSLQTLDFKNRTQNGELEIWLTMMETRIEAYRTAYRTLTKIDLGEKQ